MDAGYCQWTATPVMRVSLITSDWSLRVESAHVQCTGTVGLRVRDRLSSSMRAQWAQIKSRPMALSGGRSAESYNYKAGA